MAIEGIKVKIFKNNCLLIVIIYRLTILELKDLQYCIIMQMCTFENSHKNVILKLFQDILRVL